MLLKQAGLVPPLGVLLSLSVRLVDRARHLSWKEVSLLLSLEHVVLALDDVLESLGCSHLWHLELFRQTSLHRSIESFDTGRAASIKDLLLLVHVKYFIVDSFP